MSLGKFELLLAEMGPHLMGQGNNFREPIGLAQHTAVCLR